MRLYGLSVALASTGIAMLAGAAVLSHDEPAPAAVRDGRGGSVWGASYFPNVPLITHDGRTVRFFDDLIEGRVVALNFIYTTCPDACPMETARGSSGRRSARAAERQAASDRDARS